MKISVIIPVFNEERNLAALLDSLIKQTLIPHEILLIDDGSKDRSGEIILEFAAKHPQVKYFFQKNQGAASARNVGWKEASGEICVFTDGDCIPEKNWLEEIVSPFTDTSVASVGGAYKTLNTACPLASFIGLEIADKYKDVEVPIDCHGTYNLAVRKNILEEVGGFDENLRTSGEDWDLTYKIAKNFRLVFRREAIVGHFHPESLPRYLLNQYQRAKDRIKLYFNHPDKMRGDIYTSPIIKYRLFASLLLVFLFISISLSILKPSLALFLAGLLILASLDLALIASMSKKHPWLAIYGMPVQLFRNYAWLTGIFAGFIRERKTLNKLFN